MNQELTQDQGIPTEDQHQLKRRMKWTFSQLGWAVFMLMLLAQVGAGLLAVVGMLAAPGMMGSPWGIWLLSYLPLYLLAFPIFCLMLKKVPAQQPRDGAGPLGAGTLVKLLFLCLGVTYALNYLSLGINGLIGLLKGSPVMNPLAEMVMEPLSTFLFVGLIAPVMEEVIFRRLLLNRLLPFGERVAVYGTAFLFALFHANLSQLFYAFVLGLIFARVTLHTGGIRTTVLLHIVLNNIGSLLIPSLHGLLPEKIGMLVIYLLTLVLIVVGAVVWRRLPRNSLAPSSLPFTPQEQRRIFVRNPGMIAYLILILLLMIMVILAPVAV